MQLNTRILTAVGPQLYQGPLNLLVLDNNNLGNTAVRALLRCAMHGHTVLSLSNCGASISKPPKLYQEEKTRAPEVECLEGMAPMPVECTLEGMSGTFAPWSSSLFLLDMENPLDRLMLIHCCSSWLSASYRCLARNWRVMLLLQMLRVFMMCMPSMVGGIGTLLEGCCSGRTKVQQSWMMKKCHSLRAGLTTATGSAT